MTKTRGITDKEGQAVAVYTLRRLIQMIPALLGIVVITFMISRVLPGDPAVMLAGNRLHPRRLKIFEAAWDWINRSTFNFFIM